MTEAPHLRQLAIGNRQSAIPLVSIVVPSYNQSRYIDRTIRSIVEQDYAAVEVIVMDGGSTDDTVERLKRWGDRITWVSEKDDGQSDAINRGFARARGEIYGWLNSDDTLVPGAVRAAVEAFSKQPELGAVYGDADFIDDAGRRIRRCAHVEPFNRRRLINVSDFIVQPAAFFRREAFDAVGGLDASLHYAMDYDLWLKIAQRYDMKYVPRLMANYRWLGTNKSAEGGRTRLDEVARVAAKHGAKDLPAYFRLECIAIHLAEALRGGGLEKIRQAIRELTTSPTAMKSLLSWRTWRIIWTGQVLRRAGRQMKAQSAS